MRGAEIRGRLLGVALGAAPAALLAVGGDVVNVYTGEVVRWDVAVADGRIAAVGPDLASLAGPATERLDVRGKVLVPLAAVCDRRSGLRRGLGVVQGFGLREGAVVSTLSFDTADLVLVGASREALAAAGQRAVALGGGFVVVDGRGAVRAELPLPLGGIAAAGSVSELAHGLETVTGALRDLGSQLGRPLLTLQTLTFSAIPALRLTTRGLLVVKSREHVPALL